jgi:hypothetical protein
VLQGFDLHIARRGAGGHRRSERERQVDRHHARLALLRPRPRRRARRRPRRARRHPALAAPPGRRRVRGELPLLRHGAGQHRLRPSGRHRRGDRGGGPRGPGPRVHRGAPAGLRHRGGRARADPLGRAAPTHRAGPGHRVRPAHPDPRRRHQRHRLQDRRGHPRGPARRHGRPDHAAGGPPASTLHLADRIVVVDDGRVVEQGTHDELLAAAPSTGRCSRGSRRTWPRRRATGSRRSPPWRPVGGDGTTRRPGRRRRGRQRAGGGGHGVASAAIGAPEHRTRTRGGGGGGGGRSWRLNLAPTPELLARVAALRPVRDVAKVDLAKESRHDRSFNLRRLLREFRRPLSSGWSWWCSTRWPAWPARS